MSRQERVGTKRASRRFVGASRTIFALVVVALAVTVATPSMGNAHPATLAHIRSVDPTTPATRPAWTPPAESRARRASRSMAVRTIGASPWRGAPLRHPRGIAFYPSVMRWANMVSHVMADHGIPRKYLPGILAQMQQESAGYPFVVNLWDINAKRGTPSKGLLQIIAPTYATYAIPEFRSLNYQTHPYANVWAALNYVKNRYGMTKFQRWNMGQNQGY